VFMCFLRVKMNRTLTLAGPPTGVKQKQQRPPGFPGGLRPHTRTQPRMSQIVVSPGANVKRE